MRKFKFVGNNPSDYKMPDNNFIPKYNVLYDGDIKIPRWLENIEGYSKEYPEDWQEVTEPETNRIPNHDQPASSMTKFEMAVLGNVKMILSLPFYKKLSDDIIVSDAIDLTKETFKQLDNLKK